MEEKMFLTERHMDELPAVRIKKAALKNFKSVEYGEITLNCGKEFVLRGTESDILGLYGQNGSGKTSFIESLAILKRLMSGRSVPGDYADCVAVGEETAELSFVFDLQYPDGRIREATYAFCISGVNLTEEELQAKYKDAPEGYAVPAEGKRVVVSDERFSLLWEGASKRQMIIDTSPEDVPFSPTTKRRELVGGNRKTLITLEVNKRLASEKSASFIFSDPTLQVFWDNDAENVFLQVLAELRLYAQDYLFVLDTKSTGFINLNVALPIYTQAGMLLLKVDSTQRMNAEVLEPVRKLVDRISTVLEQIVPGLKIGVKELAQTLDSEGRKTSQVIPMAYRNGQELPLRDESDGVRKIISELGLFISAFNEESVTIAIDEFDAGIFEYLLGEILQAFQDYGKGQFIFTSHNLRPLEVINRKFLYFTSTNPSNRYIRLKNISATNNLRDTYFREIVMSEQEEEFYNKTKRYKMVEALKTARDL